MTFRGLECAGIPRLPPSSFRPPIRHSRDGGNPEGRGGGTNDTQTLSARGTHGVLAPAGMTDWYENLPMPALGAQSGLPNNHHGDL